jgi:hypothetical protein
MKPTKIQESYTVNGKTFDNLHDAEKYRDELDAKNFNKYPKSSFDEVVYYEIYITTGTVPTLTIVVMEPSQTPLLPTKKCRITQTIGVPRVRAGWNKSSLKREPTEKLLFNAKNL